jgi:hypothetical protein
VNTSRKPKSLLHGLHICSQEPFQRLRSRVSLLPTLPRLTGAQKRPEGILLDGLSIGAGNCTACVVRSQTEGRYCRSLTRGVGWQAA